MGSTIEDYVRLVITLVFLGVFSFLIVSGRELDPNLTQLLIVAVGFYFGLDKLGEYTGKVFKSKSNGDK